MGSTQPGDWPPAPPRPGPPLARASPDSAPGRGLLTRRPRQWPQHHPTSGLRPTVQAHASHGAGLVRLPGGHPSTSRADQALSPQTPLFLAPSLSQRLPATLESPGSTPAQPPLQVPHSWPDSLLPPPKNTHSPEMERQPDMSPAPVTSLRPRGRLFGLPSHLCSGAREASPALQDPGAQAEPRVSSHGAGALRPSPHPNPEPKGPGTFHSLSARPTGRAWRRPRRGSQPQAPRGTRMWPPPGEAALSSQASTPSQGGCPQDAEPAPYTHRPQ